MTQLTDADVISTPEVAKEVAKEEAIYTFKGKDFKSKDEMTNFIHQLEAEKSSAEAYAKGMKEATLTQMKTQDAEKVDEEKFLRELEDEFFTNPAKTLDTKIKQAEEKAYKRAQEEMAPIKQQLAAEQQTKLWEKFYKSNADLAGKEEIVEALVAKYSVDPAYAQLPINEGLEKIAAKARNLLKSERVLENNTVQLASSNRTAGAGFGKTSASAENTPLDFVSQVRQANRRKK
jgi:uncharacterized protein YdcH (DUF465 family)